MMKKQNNLLTWLLNAFIMLATSGNAWSQQDPQIGQYMVNKTFANPAATGSQGGNFTFFYRSQWVNMPGSPKTFGALADIGFNSGIGLGLNIINTGQGLISFTKVLTNYSYKIKISEEVTSLYLGLQAGVLQYSIDTKGLRTHDAVSEDQTLNSENLRKMVPDFGFGAMLKINTFYVGIALPHMLQPKMKFINSVIDTAALGQKQGRTSFAKIFRHYYLTTGADFIISPLVVLQPSVFVKYIPGVPMSADINVNTTIQDRYWGGVGYRVGVPGGFVAMAGLNIRNLKFGYSYEITRSPLSSYGGASHELIINYQFAGTVKVRQNKKPYFIN